MKNIKNKMIAALFTLTMLMGCFNALGESAYGVQYTDYSDTGFVFICVAAVASLIWLGVTTYRRTRYISVK